MTRPSNKEIRRTLHNYFAHVDSHNVEDFTGAFSIFVHKNNEEKTRDNEVAFHICQFVGGDMETVANALVDSIQQTCEQNDAFKEQFFKQLVDRMSDDTLNSLLKNKSGILRAVAVDLPKDATPEQIAALIGKHIFEETKEENARADSRLH